MSDPRYLEKIPALFCEFEETGTNKCLGYAHPGDLRASYPKFFWNVVYQYIEKALHYLEVTEEGRQIIANLYRNVTIVEAENQKIFAQKELKLPEELALKKIGIFPSIYLETYRENSWFFNNILGDVQFLDVNQRKQIWLEGKVGV